MTSARLPLKLGSPAQPLRLPWQWAAWLAMSPESAWKGPNRIYEWEPSYRFALALWIRSNCANLIAEVTQHFVYVWLDHPDRLFALTSHDLNHSACIMRLVYRIPSIRPRCNFKVDIRREIGGQSDFECCAYSRSAWHFTAMPTLDALANRGLKFTCSTARLTHPTLPSHRPNVACALSGGTMLYAPNLGKGSKSTQPVLPEFRCVHSNAK